MKIEILTKLNGIVVSHFPDSSEDDIRKATFMKFDYNNPRELMHKISQWVEMSRQELNEIDKRQLNLLKGDK